MKTLLLQNLTKRYLIKKDKYFTALKATNISFDSTGLVAITGKSGSGKSTLLNLIARIDTPSEGDIFLNGKSYKTFKKKRIQQFIWNIIRQSIIIYRLDGVANEKRTPYYQETRRGRQPHYLCPYQGRHIDRHRQVSSGNKLLPQ